MADVVWRFRAARQLDEIFQYLQQQNPSAALRYISELKQACQSLKRPVNTTNATARSFSATILSSTSLIA
jgi:plasmid stabilization system protein ParE